ncbi:MAG: thiamine-phosphate kinase [Cyclobacteriaceae bacterium]|nr:thiamine-phosphate kinase [Cyclobacteriaceae bacterium]
MKPPRTEISTIGEFGLIERIKSGVKTIHASTVLGIDDDAAIIATGTTYTLLSTDMLLEGIHFDLSYMPLQHLGYKSISVNVSDIAAMNGIPRQVTVNLGLSNRFSVEAVDAFYDGIFRACREYKVDLIGGDTTASSSGLVISVSILGEVEKEKVVRRKTAKLNDIICVTGDLGAAYIGLQVLEREKQEFLVNPDMQPQLKGYDYLVGRQLRPEARMDIIYELGELNIVPSSMIDVSDGLASDLMHICKQSGLGANIFEDKLPYDHLTLKTAMEFKLDVITAVMNGGEDYELLFTISQENFDKVKNHRDIHFIGYMQEAEKGINLVTRGDQAIPVTAQGWTHFDPKK